MPHDLLIAGAGAAGMFAALAAAHGGASVLLLERDLHGPSNLKVSGGLFPGAGTRMQAEAGVQDSAAQFAADIHNKASGAVDSEVLHAIAGASTDCVHFLADEVGLKVALLKDLSAPGHSAPRLHATPGQSGRELHALLREAVATHPAITLLADAEVTDLVVAESATPRVTGARVRLAGAVQSYASRAVLLATGGFAANPELLAQYIPEMKGALHIGAGANDGCAVRWGRDLGADVAFMQGYQGQGHVNPPEGRTRLGMALPPQGAFMVNRFGHRFVAEDIGPSELAAHVLAQPGGVALEVFDARIHQFALAQGPYREAFEAGKILSAPSPSELARLFDIPEHEFLASFEQHRQAVQTGHDAAQGRKRFGPALEAPLFGAWVTGALAHTQGGLRVDRFARVLRTDGSVIHGLYAAGGAAASVSGVGGAGYLPGNGLAQSFALALLTARHLTAHPVSGPTLPALQKSRPPA